MQANKLISKLRAHKGPVCASMVGVHSNLLVKVVKSDLIKQLEVYKGDECHLESHVNEYGEMIVDLDYNAT